MQVSLISNTYCNSLMVALRICIYFLDILTSESCQTLLRTLISDIILDSKCVHGSLAGPSSADGLRFDVYECMRRVQGA